jgi:uncharacterized protein YbjT (DUF2867 family)
MRIVIFGANGQTGRLLTEQALAGGHAFGAAPYELSIASAST